MPSDPRLDRELRGRFIARRVDLPCKLAGFELPPPCQVHLKFLPVGDRWTLLALAPPGMPTRVARWLQPFGPAAINIGPGVAPKVLRAFFDKLPPTWARILSAVNVHYVQVTPDGSASIFVEDSRQKVDRFVASVRGDSPIVRERKTQSSAERVELTARQSEVLSLAVALGYYETPRKLDLRALAKKLQLSVGAVSELLRRGESLIITHYIDSWSESRWQSSEASSAPGGAAVTPEQERTRQADAARRLNRPTPR